MVARVVMNRRAVAELAKSPEWEAHATKAANQIKAATASNASDPEYGKSLDVDSRTEGDEIVVRCGTDHPFAHLDEWGSINNPATGAMRRAVEGLGMEAEFS